MSGPRQSRRRSSRGSRRRLRNLRKVGFAVAPALLLIAGLELGARALIEPPAMQGGGPLGWTMRPGLTDYPVDQQAPQLDFTVTTNSEGLRTPYERARGGDATRLVTFGDSTIFGWGLSAEEAPAAALEAHLEASRGGDWEVVNAGQPGYSSEQARRLAEAMLPGWAPDGILWFHPWHDVAWATPDRELLPEEPASPLLAGSALLGWFAERGRERGDGSAGPQPQENPLFPFTPQRVEPGGADPERTQVRVPPEQRAENLGRVIDAAEDAGAWIVVAILGNEHTLQDPGAAPLVEEIAAICAARGVPFVDLSREPEGAALGDVTLPGDPGHFTAEANRLFAARLAEVLP